MCLVLKEDKREENKHESCLLGHTRICIISSRKRFWRILCENCDQICISRRLLRLQCGRWIGRDKSKCYCNSKQEMIEMPHLSVLKLTLQIFFYKTHHNFIAWRIQHMKSQECQNEKSLGLKQIIPYQIQWNIN